MNSNEPQPVSPVFAPGTALRLGGALVAGVALLGVLGLVSRSNNHALEGFEALSALGDTAYFQPAPGEKPAAPIFSLNNQSFTLAQAPAVAISDTRMLRAGIDAATGQAIYSVNEAVKGRDVSREKKKGPGFYVKTGPGEFHALQEKWPAN